VEPSGKLRLSRKAWLMEQAGQEIDLADFGRPKPKGGDRGRGGPRGGRGGDRRGGGGGGRR
jgi:polyribonucleotide nucleotidyltransferase